MDDELMGVFIIVAFVVIGIISGGSVFKGPDINPNGATQTSTKPTSNFFLGNGNSQSSSGQTTYGNNGIKTYGRTGEIGSNSQKTFGQPSYSQTGGGTFSNNIRNFSDVIQSLIEQNNASQYQGKVRISDIPNRGTFDEYAVLYANLDPNEQIMMANWSLHSTVTGSTIYINGASNIATPGVRSLSPINLSNGAQVIVSQSSSPIGSSFRVNKCVGYLDQNRNITPSIQFSCPRISEDSIALATLNNKCLDFIDSLQTCKIPHGGDYPDDIGSTCKDYISNNMNYTTCVLNHRIDSDFYKNDWRIYAGHAKILWRDKHEHIQLLDDVGKVVDSVSY